MTAKIFELNDWNGQRYLSDNTYYLEFDNIEDLFDKIDINKNEYFSVRFEVDILSFGILKYKFAFGEPERIVKDYDGDSKRCASFECSGAICQSGWSCDNLIEDCISFYNS